jgi:hypothetical protein
MKKEVTEVFFGFIFSVIRRMEYRLQSAWRCRGSEGWNRKGAKAAKGRKEDGGGIF